MACNIVVRVAGGGRVCAIHHGGELQTPETGSSWGRLKTLDIAAMLLDIPYQILVPRVPFAHRLGSGRLIKA